MSWTHARPAGRPDSLLHLFHDARGIQRAVDTMAGLLLAALFASMRVDIGASGHRPAALCQDLAQQLFFARCYFASKVALVGAKILCLLTLAAHAAPRV